MWQLRRRFYEHKRFNQVRNRYLTHNLRRLMLDLRHNLRHHCNGKLYECHCGEIFKSNSKLTDHQQTHSEKVSCKVCRKQFSYKDSLRSHWKTKHLKTHGVFENSERNKSKFRRYLEILTINWIPHVFINSESSEQKRSIHLWEVWKKGLQPKCVSYA